jgi:hypothetical protein
MPVGGCVTGAFCSEDRAPKGTAQGQRKLSRRGLTFSGLRWGAARSGRPPARSTRDQSAPKGCGLTLSDVFDHVRQNY